MITHKLLLAFGVCGALALVEAPRAEAQVSSTVGSVRGVIKDKATGAAVGATVIATSPALVGQQVAITEEGGQYFLPSLSPGLYVLTVIYGDATFSRGNVLIQVGKEAVVNITLDTSGTAGRPKGETIVIKGSVPIVDQGSTKTGVTLTGDYTRNVPTGRTFAGVLGSAAGAQQDAFGTGFGGATSVENTYIVEGMNTTDTGQGQLSSNLPTEFIEETEVITGGYNAEYGRATGGIINVVTKQGSDELHGSVFGYLRPGAFVANAKLVQHQGGSIDTKTDLNYAGDLGAELGGPVIKKKVWFHLGFNPHAVGSTITRIVRSQVDENQDGVPDTNPDGSLVHTKVHELDTPTSSRIYYFTGKLNGAIGEDHQWQISAFGNPGVSTDGYTSSLLPSAQTLLIHDTSGAVDVTAKWTSKLDDGKLQLDAVVGFHRGYSHQSSPTAAGRLPTVFYGYERSLYDFADVEGPIDACADNTSTDKYPKIRNCPVLNYAESGLGLLENRTNDRYSALISATRRVKALGYHTIKAGLDLEATTYISRARYTGGGEYERFCNTDPATGQCSDAATANAGTWQTTGYSRIIRNLTPDELADPMNIELAPGEELCSGNRAVCTASSTLAVDTHDLSLGAYLQDSWQLVPYFTINYGLRYEQQRGYTASQLRGTVSPTGEPVPDLGFTVHNVAPRVGFIFDPTKEGKAKLFGHWGRFFENIPLDLNSRGFGGEIDRIGLINGHGGCPIDRVPGTNPSAALAQCGDNETQALLGGGSEYVTPHLRGQYTQELIVGTEYEVAPDIKVGVDYVHRTMPSVIEDILTPDGEYFITNPGQDLSSEAADLRAQAAKLMGSANPADHDLAKIYEYRAHQVDRLKNFDAPTRNYDAVRLSLTQRPTSHSLILASYTWSKTRGNYPGLFSTETNQLNPNGSSQYDLASLLANRFGPLGLDRTHNLKIDGFYQFDLHKLGALTIGASVRAQSGIPHNALGADPVYAQGEAYLLPRGSFARSPMTSEIDVHLSYGYRFSKATMLEGFVNIFDLVNRQDELTSDENYTFDPSLPIVGGDARDLEHLKAVDASGVEHSATVAKNPNFGHLATRQPPRTVQLGFRLTF